MMHIEEQVPLAPLTTFKIGGPARFFVRVRSVEELRKSLDFARDKKLTTFVLGGGSNVLIDDAGFDGLVIKIEFGGIEKKDGEIVAGAGEGWDALVRYAIERNLWGIENLSGIPGTVGAAPMQNIGAYGAELSHVLEWVEALDTDTLALTMFSNRECVFGYRTSRFKKDNRFIITRVALTLKKNGTPNLSYADLNDLVGRSSVTLGKIREAVLAIRSKKFPDLTTEGTAGSFFLNPVVSKEVAIQLKKQYPALPQFEATGGMKLSLAWLLDNVLHLKGTAQGGARVFERQPLVLVAEKDTRAREVQVLAKHIAALVQKNFGITLEPEVRII